MRAQLGLMALSLLLASCSTTPRPVPGPLAPTPPEASPVAAGTPAPASTIAAASNGKPIILDPQNTDGAHDPTLVREGNHYYVFHTGQGIPIRCSDNLLQWTVCGQVFQTLPDWLTQAVPGVGDLWAPDLAFWGGKWRLYYAASTFGKNRSAIGLATNVTLDAKSPDYRWVDEGQVFASAPPANYNAIDPNITFDTSGQPWLAFGSFWSGLKLFRLDAATGKPAEPDPQLTAIAERPAPGAIEGAYITHRGDYYYLFASFDQCGQGILSSYNIRVGRAAQISGPYVDRDGKAMLDGGGTLVLEGGKRWKGPGHNSIFLQDGTYWLVYHAYDAQAAGTPKLRIEALGGDEQGWPVAPSASAQ